MIPTNPKDTMELLREAHQKEMERLANLPTLKDKFEDEEKRKEAAIIKKREVREKYQKFEKFLKEIPLDNEEFFEVIENPAMPSEEVMRKMLPCELEVLDIEKICAREYKNKRLELINKGIKKESLDEVEAEKVDDTDKRIGKLSDKDFEKVEEKFKEKKQAGKEEPEE